MFPNTTRLRVRFIRLADGGFEGETLRTIEVARTYELSQIPDGHHSQRYLVKELILNRTLLILPCPFICPLFISFLGAPHITGSPHHLFALVSSFVRLVNG